MWGYQVATSSQACVSAINSYYHQVTHFTTPPFSLSLYYEFFFRFWFWLLSLSKLFDIKTQMGCVSFEWRFSSMEEKGLWFWKQWHMTITVSWPTSWLHISFTRLILLVLSLVCTPLSPTLYLSICIFFFFSSIWLFPPKRKPLWCVFVILLVQDQATLYEKLVFDTISYLLSEDRDDDVALELHSKVSDSVGPFDSYATLICLGTNLM